MSKTRQPKNLYFLFFVEMWERFAFYIMNGLLVLYLSKVFLFSDSKSYMLFGIFSSLIWLTPMLGGNVADRLFGFQRAIILGGVLLTVGYGLLTSHVHWVFYFGLGLLLIGNGFFKANIPSLLGTLYDGPDDPRRDGGFTIYYMGINLGALIGPVVAGIVVAKFNWQAGFAVASIGMLLGLILFCVGRKWLGRRGHIPDEKKLYNRTFFGLSNSMIIYVLSIVLSAIGAVLLFHTIISTGIMIVAGIAGVIYYFYVAFQQSQTDRNKMLACLVLVVISIAFWVLYQQQPMVLNLFTERNVDRHLFGIYVPTVTFQSFNPFFIFVLTPVLNWFWQKTAGTRFSFSTAMKFSLATILMGLGFLMLTWCVDVSKTGTNISAWWVVWSYGLQSLAELMLSPVGLAMMTGMAPKGKTGMMIGMWFLSTAASNTIAGFVAQYADIPQNIKSGYQAGHIYANAFAVYGWVAVIVGVFALVMVPKLSKMMKSTKSVKA